MKVPDQFLALVEELKHANLVEAKYTVSAMQLELNMMNLQLIRHHDQCMEDAIAIVKKLQTEKEALQIVIEHENTINGELGTLDV